MHLPDARTLPDRKMEMSQRLEYSIPYMSSFITASSHHSGPSKTPALEDLTSRFHSKATGQRQKYRSPDMPEDVIIVSKPSDYPVMKNRPPRIRSPGSLSTSRNIADLVRSDDRFLDHLEVMQYITFNEC